MERSSCAPINTPAHRATREARRRSFRVLVSLFAVLKLINVSMGKLNYLIQSEPRPGKRSKQEVGSGNSITSIPPPPSFIHLDRIFIYFCILFPFRAPSLSDRLTDGKYGGKGGIRGGFIRRRAHPVRPLVTTTKEDGFGYRKYNNSSQSYCSIAGRELLVFKMQFVADPDSDHFSYSSHYNCCRT